MPFSLSLTPTSMPALVGNTARILARDASNAMAGQQFKVGGAVAGGFIGALFVCVCVFTIMRTLRKRRVNKVNSAA
jgi:hypothetical protein